MKIAFVGTGYLGLVTGACLAELGHTVFCIDINSEKIAQLKIGVVPFYEPGLNDLIQNKNLFFTTDYAEALEGADVCMIGVQTPSKADGSCDTSFVEAAAISIGEHLQSYMPIVNKSTVPVGTSNLIKEWIQQGLSKRDVAIPFDVVACPEFLREGSAILDCQRPDRIIFGTDSARAIGILNKLYAHVSTILIMDVLSAEMTKFASNAMLATRISFMNELADICKKVGANINEVKKGMGADSRIGNQCIHPGIGYGGSCFPKDLSALISIADSVGSRSDLLQAVKAINLRQKKWLAESIVSYFGTVKGKTIAIWGLAFKPNTDDLREAPSLVIVEQLIQEGALLRVYDPVAMPNGKKLLTSPKITWCENEVEAAVGADAIALITEWEQFQHVDFKTIKAKMKGIAFFDGRNQHEPVAMKKNGFDYICVGVPDEKR